MQHPGKPHFIQLRPWERQVVTIFFAWELYQTVLNFSNTNLLEKNMWKLLI